MAITAKQVKELRDATSVSMMQCKKALTETNGDMEAAIKILRERGQAAAAKRADREANEGIIAATVTADAQTGAMVEVNCETDFVSRNEAFQSFVNELCTKAVEFETGALGEAVSEQLVQKTHEMGEKVAVRENVTMKVEGTGAIASYVHMGGRVGVLVEIGCEKAETISAPAFTGLAKDVTLHIAAAAPQYLNRDEVPSALLDEEMNIARKQLEGKPENIMEGILKGKANKFYSQICLLEQGFVKEDKLSVTKLLEQVGKELGDTLTIKRYTRFQLGA
ncbi:translation elongation factor Ts [Verrucomicrobiota bacterium]